LKSIALPRLDRIANALFPPACPICRADIDTPRGLCPDCWRDLAFLDGPGCQYCSRPIPGALPGESGLVCDDCLHHLPLWQRGMAVFRYEGSGRKLVLALKHGDRQDLVPPLGTWALRRAGPLIAAADLIAPVPLHWTRRLKRRGNQAAELARWLARASGKTRAFRPRLLIRNRATHSQDGKDRAARRANLAGALALGTGARVQGKRVLLVDDVLTTGATLNAATAILKAGGARAVDILVLALVVRDRAGYMPDPDDEGVGRPADRPEKECAR